VEPRITPLSHAVTSAQLSAQLVVPTVALTVASCKHAMSNDIPLVSVDCIRTLRANATSAAAAAAVFYCGAERCDTDMTNASKKNLECKLYISVFSTPNSRLPISAFVICHGVDKRRPADTNMK